ncbi:MAG TPA: isocitrate/isopropylmalate family dehydrogenase [Kofleriaceae bacterium]|nr:isocitrate/isopropylmalate family dehydrogenase [Kofleriaceae bacterium]
MGGGGTGPELIDAIIPCLDAVERLYGVKFERVRFADEPWMAATETERMDDGLLAAMTEFYAMIQGRGGAILRGAVSAPVLYRVRERFEQHFKVNPIDGIPELAGLTRFDAESLDGLHFLMVRENTTGAFHTEGEDTPTGAAMRIEHHRIDVERLARFSFRLAPPGGSVALAMAPRKMGRVGALWQDVFEDVARAHSDLKFRVMYPNLEKIGQFVRTRRNAGKPLGLFDVPLNSFDVIVGPELSMDWLMDDVGWAIQGEPFLGCSGNFSPSGFSSYQTVHGTVIPAKGKDIANPIGMVHAVAMYLRHSCGLADAASALERAVRGALARGLRTFDLHRGDPRYELVGTRAMVGSIVECLSAEVARSRRAVHA